MAEVRARLGHSGTTLLAASGNENKPTLVAADGIWAVLDPQQWPGGEALITMITDRVPRHLLTSIDSPARLGGQAPPQGQTGRKTSRERVSRLSPRMRKGP